MDIERAVKFSNRLGNLINVVNGMKLSEINEILADIAHDVGLGPMVDPGRWRDGTMFDSADKSAQVLRALGAFKIEVAGIGRFDDLYTEGPRGG